MKKCKVNRAQPARALRSLEEYINSLVCCVPVRNLLDNSYFLYPVNTKGESVYSGSGESINRWRAYHSDTVHTITENGFNVMTNGGYNPNAYQVVHPKLINMDDVYTGAACDINGNIYLWSGKITSQAPSRVGAYLSGDNVLFRLNGNFTWVWAMLIPGEYTLETLPNYWIKERSIEIAQCELNADL